MRRRVLAAATACLLLAAAAPAAPAAQTVGLQVHPLWDGVDDAGMAAQLDRAAATGARTVRIDVGWASLESEGKGLWSDWYLRRLDLAVTLARERGVWPLLTLFDTPCWASSAPDDLRDGCSGPWWERGVQRYAPRDPADYADALAFLVRRYGARVGAWEIWNEPNQPAFFVAPDGAAAYAKLLAVAYAAAKAADPTVTIVGGALAEADAGFTQRLYELGVKGSFDVWSVHPYSGDRSPLDPVADGEAKRSFVRGVPDVRRVMLAHGDDKPLWLTELGWNTSSLRGGPAWANGVEERTQAHFMDEAFAQVRAWPYVEVAVWYALADRSADASDPVANYGLLRADGSPKPSYDAFRFIATAMREGPVSPPPPAPPAGRSLP